MRLERVFVYCVSELVLYPGLRWTVSEARQIKVAWIQSVICVREGVS